MAGPRFLGTPSGQSSRTLLYSEGLSIWQNTGAYSGTGRLGANDQPQASGFFPCFDLQLPLGIHAHIHADMHTSSLSVLSAKEFVGMFPAWKAGERVKLGGPRNA